MKCPYCGNELNGKELCSGCGRKVKIPKQDIEVEYKEFPVSEFLEIRKRHQTSQGKEKDESTREDLRKQESSYETERERPAPVQETKNSIQKTGPVEHDNKKKPFSTVIIILLIIAVIIGGYYFWESWFRSK
jgi:hypothetical protein